MSDCLARALDYHTYDLAPLVLPYGAKEPEVSWRRYQTRAPGRETVREWFGDGQMHNIALIAGRASGNLAILDSDTYDDYEHWLCTMIGVGIRPWVVRRDPTNDPDDAHAGGGKLLLRTPKATKSMHAGDTQILGQGSYGLVPLSQHPLGPVYHGLLGHPGELFMLPRMDAIPGLVFEEAPRTPEPSDFAWRLLYGDDDVVGRYHSRSEAEQALCLSLLNSGFRYPDAERLLLNDEHKGPGKFKERYAENPDQARAYLQYTWDKAREWAETHTGRAVRLARALTIWANERPWKGRSGSYDRAIYLAHLKIVIRCGRSTYGASCRELAEIAATSHVTASKATRRLIEDYGLLSIHALARMTSKGNWRATRYQIKEPNDLGDWTNLNSPSQEVLSDCKGLSADAFRYQGLNKTGFDVYQTLALRGRMSPEELADATGRHVRTVRRRVSQMLEMNLVEDCGEDLYRLSPTGDLDHAAWFMSSTRGVKLVGKGVRQRERHRKQRRKDERDRKRLSRRAGRRRGQR